MVWKEIKGYEGRYMVSDTGKIMSLPRTIKTSRGYRTISKKRILKCSKLRNGTKVIRLVDKDGNKKNYTVAQVVARTFIENDDSKRTFVRHIDGKEGNNNVKNLKWDYPGRAASTDYGFKRRKNPRIETPARFKHSKTTSSAANFKRLRKRHDISASRIPSESVFV